MTLPDLWFLLIAVLFTGFFVLEGFDFGVGALHRVVGRTEEERRVAINTIGPFWDGNEVWLVVGGAGIFAAFPDWYATWLSASYLGVVLILAALLLRGVSFEFRGKVDSARWKAFWSGTLVAGSVVAPFVLGLALGNLVVGLPVDSSQEYTGTFWGLFTGYGSWTALTVLLLCLLHGTTFLGLRTVGTVRARAQRIGRWIGVATLVAVVVWGGWTLGLGRSGVGAKAALVLVPVAVVAALWGLLRGGDGSAFVATTLAMVGTLGALFASLYPDVLVSSTSSSNNLTVAGTASGHYALQVMTVVACVMLPLVLLYQAWTYVVFRHRIGGAVPVPGQRSTQSAG